MKYVKLPWLWTLLLGTVVGAGVGFGLGRWPGRSGPAASRFMKEFSLPEVAAKAAAKSAGTGGLAWEVKGDTTFSGWEIARKRLLTRRIVARTTLPVEAQDVFVGNLNAEVKARLGAYGAGFLGEVSTSEARGSRDEKGDSVSSRIDLPRLCYAFGNTHGVADVWLVAWQDQVTVIVTLTEAD